MITALVLSFILVLGFIVGWVIAAEARELNAKRQRLAALRAEREQAHRRYMGKLTPLGKSTIIVDKRK